MAERPDTPGKPPYSRKFIAAQKKRLQDERESLLEDMNADSEELRAWSNHDDAGVDQHMADDASALTEQQLDASLIDNARYVLAEIDDALRRIEDGTYGWDEEGECWIREERLKALPWARHEIETQQKIEERMRISDRDAYTHDPKITSL
jgi:RNA polymerase-binding transcription factor DksA